MGCLLHLLCEFAHPKIQMQKTGPGVIFHPQEVLPASDLERCPAQGHHRGDLFDKFV